MISFNIFFVIKIITYSSAISLILCAPIALYQNSIKRLLGLFIFLMSFSVAGSTIGHIAGLSRESVAGDILPASLVFMGIGAGYIFALDIKKGLVAATTMMCFSISMLSYYKSSSLERFGVEIAEKMTEINIKEESDFRNYCLKFILSKDYIEISRIDKKRIALYCKEYVSFLK